MAQNVTIAGNQYPDVPSILVPKTGGGGNAIFADPSVVTAVAVDVASGKYFLDSSGVLTQGTASGGSSWTLVASTSYQINTTSTTVETVATFETGHSEIWTSDKIVYIRIRDTSGKRNTYFYGSDTFIINAYPANNSTTTSTSGSLRMSYRYVSNSYNTFTSTNGIYPDNLYNNGNIRIRARYSSSVSGTIDSTYSVEVYLLDPPTGAPIFT